MANFMVMKNSSSGGCLPLSRGYIHAHDHNIETSSSLKPLDQSKQTLSGALLEKGNES